MGKCVLVADWNGRKIFTMEQSSLKKKQAKTRKGEKGHKKDTLPMDDDFTYRKLPTNLYFFYYKEIN